MKSNHKIALTTLSSFVLFLAMLKALDSWILETNIQPTAQQHFFFWTILTSFILVYTKATINYISAKNLMLKKINTQNDELKHTKQTLVHSTELKSAFLANISHEIRTPMNAISGFISLVTEDTKLLPKYLDIINTNCNYLLSILNNIVEVSKIETNQLNKNEIQCNIYKILTQLKSSYTIDSKVIKLDLIMYDINENDYIVTDKQKLIDSLKNLIDNAIKFTKNGNILITCFITKDNVLNFSVKDTGIGICSKKLDLIFNQFYQVSKNTSGSGLGLSITKAYIETLGGTLKVRSLLNTGSTFHITIPLSFPKKTIQEIKPHERITVDKKTVLLVVDDNKINYLLLKEILHKNNFDTLWAENGKVAVDKAKDETNNIELVLMDISMPVMDGYEAYSKIREFNTDIPIIANTAHTLHENLPKVLSHGFDDFLSKPIDKQLLLNTINNHLKAKKKNYHKTAI